VTHDKGLASHVKFTLQSKNDRYVNFEQAIYRDEGDIMRFSYPAGHSLAAEFEAQMIRLLHEYKGDGEYLSSIIPMNRMRGTMHRMQRLWPCLGLR
jgi:hypothetical protein